MCTPHIIYKHLVMMCAVEWTCSPYRSTDHIAQIRHFTEQLDDTQMYTYFDLLCSVDDVEMTTYIVSKIFYDWVDDYDFQVELCVWFVESDMVQSLEFFSSTYDFKIDAILEGLKRVYATSCINHCISKIWYVLCDRYAIDTHVVDLVFGIIDMIDHTGIPGLFYFQREYWFDAFTLLIVQVQIKLTRTEFCHFIGEVVHRLMQKNDNHVVQRLCHLYFRHFSKARLMTIFLNWYPLENNLLPEYPMEVFEELSLYERDQVFSSMCVTNNIKASLWVSLRTPRARYTLDIHNEKIVHFTIKEDVLFFTLFDDIIDTRLNCFGFRARYIDALDHKNDECAVCYDNMESVVVLSCFPTHQMCGECCERMMTINMKKKCPLCRESIYPNECHIYVCA